MQKRPIIVTSLLIVATPYVNMDMRVLVRVYVCASVCVYVRACVSVGGGGVVCVRVYVRVAAHPELAT